MRTLQLLVVAGLLVAGCASAPSVDRVQPFGAGKFIVAYGSMFGASKSMAACVRDANRFCELKGKVMEPGEKHQKGGTAELIFTCQ